VVIIYLHVIKMSKLELEKSFTTALSLNNIPITSDIPSPNDTLIYDTSLNQWTFGPAGSASNTGATGPTGPSGPVLTPFDFATLTSGVECITGSYLLNIARGGVSYYGTSLGGDPNGGTKIFEPGYYDVTLTITSISWKTTQGTANIGIMFNGSVVAERQYTVSSAQPFIQLNTVVHVTNNNSVVTPLVVETTQNLIIAANGLTYKVVKLT